MWDTDNKQWNKCLQWNTVEYGIFIWKIIWNTVERLRCSGLLNFPTIELWSQMMFSCGGLFYALKDVSNFPDLYPVDADSTTTPSFDNQKCLQTLPIVPGGCGRQNCPQWEPLGYKKRENMIFACSKRSLMTLINSVWMEVLKMNIRMIWMSGC